MKWLAMCLAMMTGCLAGSAVAGTQEQAAAIRAEYTKAMADWTARLRSAASVEAQRTIWRQRPDGVPVARRMWSCLRDSLAEEWALEPAAWLLRSAATMKGPVSEGSAKPETWADVIEAIRGAVEGKHLGSPRLAPVCLALVSVPDPRSLALLEKIERGHPDRKVQGVAALGLSMLLKSLGDEGDVMKRRLVLLRKSIIESAEVELDGQTVAKLAEDELYVIRWLSKGRTAPDLTGKDAAGREFRLSEYDNKVVVLLFWGTWAPDAEPTMAMARDLVKRLEGKPFALVGVNSDPAETLRELVKAGEVTWRNFSDPGNKLAADYRVSSWPAALVLDRKRVIRFIGTPGSFVDLTVDALLEKPQ